jgi:uncharacterized protein YcbX
MKIHSLFVYPVKSLAGVAVDQFEMDDFGPRGDRRWMIVDDEGIFVTQRRHPELALLEAHLDEQEVEISIPGEGRFPLRPTSTAIRVQVWRDWPEALVGEQDANEALSRFCGMPLRLVYMSDETFRRVDPARVPDDRRVSFADGFPFLITSLGSLDELNSRLETPVDIRRFRPNIVIEGASPWAEDGWQEMMINEQPFRLVKPCSRCVMTTVDPDTGIKDPSVQPLRTLTSYRRTDDGVIFGMNAIHDRPGKLRVGDAVTIVKSEND